MFLDLSEFLTETSVRQINERKTNRSLTPCIPHACGGDT